MTAIKFRFVYETGDGSHELDAYDAATALYGIARSTAIISHYAINDKIIKQAPALKGAQVLLGPPKRGSLEFLLTVVPLTLDPSTAAGTVAWGVVSGTIVEATKYIYRRVSGLKQEKMSDQLQEKLRQAPGKIDALADSVEEDLVRLHRPIQNSGITLNIYGGTNHFGNFNTQTSDYVNTKKHNDEKRWFSGNVASYNANSENGRFWLTSEDRTVAFRPAQTVSLNLAKRKRLSWSLDEYVNRRPGIISLFGTTITSKQGLIKTILVHDVKRGVQS